MRVRATYKLICILSWRWVLLRLFVLQCLDLVATIHDGGLKVLAFARKAAVHLLPQAVSAHLDFL